MPRNQILFNHYMGILRHVISWQVAAVIVLLVSFHPTPAHAGQVSTRKVTLSNSAAGASSVSYDIRFNIAQNYSANALKSIRFQFCANSPLYNTSCTALGGTFVRGTGITTQTGNGSAFTNSFTAATSGTTDVLLTNATGNTLTSGQTINIVLSGFTHISTVNTEFYVRVVTCNDTTCTVGAGSNLDNGGMAVATTQTMSVTASVQEDLTFCVGTSIPGNCTTATGSSITLSPNPMTISAPSLSTTTGKMAASTNGSGGYTITYNATSFTNTTADTICTAACVTSMQSGAALGAGGTEQFGFNLVANSGGNFGTLGANFSGGTGITIQSPYATNNQIAYHLAGATPLAVASGPSAQTTYTMTYGANVATTTKPGVYTATQTFIATATF